MVLALQSDAPAVMSQESRTPFWLQSNTDPDGASHGLLGTRILDWMAHVDLKDETDAYFSKGAPVDSKEKLYIVPNRSAFACGFWGYVSEHSQVIESFEVFTIQSIPL